MSLYLPPSSRGVQSAIDWSEISEVRMPPDRLVACPYCIAWPGAGGCSLHPDVTAADLLDAMLRMGIPIGTKMPEAPREWAPSFEEALCRA